MKTALITGITGQDGSLLAQFLLEKNYSVIGFHEHSATSNTQNITHLISHPHFHLMTGDMMDSGSLLHALKTYHPHEIYNLAAQTHVGKSFEIPEHTLTINLSGTLKLLEAIRHLDMVKTCRFYQASSSEIYGNAPLTPQNETTLFAPCSPYAIAKLGAYHFTKLYRDAYGLFACNGILFNHESPIRGEDFVTRKIARAVASIANGSNKTLYLGNLDAKRDWGHAMDYVRGMWMILNHDTPDDFVLATGQSHSVRKFVECAFACVDILIDWQGNGQNEKGVHSKTGKTLVEIDPQFYRPIDIHHLVGDAAKAKQKLGWIPSYSFDELVKSMVESDLNNHA
jgi:GDPmannose 4,6-dehydratase